MLYKKAKQELTHINQLYAPQSFHIYNINFASTPMLPTTMALNGTTFARVAGNFARVAGNGKPDPANSLSVSEKVTLRAQVAFANTNTQ